MRFLQSLALIAFCLLTSSLHAETALYVAPKGDDANPGTAERPLATPAAARDAVRKLLAAGPKEDIHVFFEGGTYRLTDTLVFTAEDSVPEPWHVWYSVARNATQPAVFSGSVPVEGWTKLAESPDDLPAAAHGKVWVADVSHVRKLREARRPSPSVATQFAPGWQFLTLYQGNSRMPRARGQGFAPEKKEVRGSRNFDTLTLPAGAFPEKVRLPGAEICVIPAHTWAMNILPLGSIDREKGTATTVVPATYALGKNVMPESVWLENTLAVLDEPGEWVLDVESAKLYLWPKGERPEEIAAPVLTELVRVEGKIDYEGPKDTPVRGIGFQGLTFTQTDRFAWQGQTGWGVQHDWERFDSPSAMVRFRGAEDCRLEACRFANGGSSGVRFDLHAQKNAVLGCDFAHLGGVAVLLAGYGPGTKDVNRGNTVHSNWIRHIGELYWGSPAIFAWQSGENKISNNRIHDTPYTGIVVSGRIIWQPEGRGECARTVRWKETGIDPALGLPKLVDPETGVASFAWYDREKFLHARKNRVEHNDIHHVMQVTGDGNCIYVSGCGGGNDILENYCHDCDGRYMNAAIRCDDDQHETLIEGNIIFRTGGQGEGIIIKGRNDIRKNIIADLRPVDRHRGYIVFPYDVVTGSTIEYNVIYSCRKDQIVCYEGRARVKGQPGPKLSSTEADYNVYYCTEDPDWGQKHIEASRAEGVELHSISADPMFEDIEAGKFQFRAGSPALELGIKQPMPLDEVVPQGPCGDPRLDVDQGRLPYRELQRLREERQQPRKE
ncbi:MAG: right-handed parallel beta-helix repeat-containing protein [Planctomycetota bacterium]